MSNRAGILQRLVTPHQLCWLKRSSERHGTRLDKVRRLTEVLVSLLHHTQHALCIRIAAAAQLAVTHLGSDQQV
jgi:hypothetical protein